jgi:hypothetical protein
LDCGAGLVTTIYLSKNYFNNPSLYAYENDIFTHKYLEHIGAKYFSGDLLESLKSEKKETYNLIILSHFLEHISTSSLVNYVELLLSKLKAEELLLIEVPHDNWMKYPHLLSSNPPHVGFFSIKALKTLFNTRAHIHSCKAIGSSVHKKRSLIIKIVEKIYSTIYSVVFKVPYTMNGNCIIICVGAKH